MQDGLHRKNQAVRRFKWIDSSPSVIFVNLNENENDEKRENNEFVNEN